MAEPTWPDWAAEAIERTRFNRASASFWDAAQDLVGSGGLEPDQIAFLATLGLAELTTWAYRLDVDATLPCAGEAAARARYPEVFEHQP